MKDSGFIYHPYLEMIFDYSAPIDWDSYVKRYVWLGRQICYITSKPTLKEVYKDISDKCTEITRITSDIDGEHECTHELKKYKHKRMRNGIFQPTNDKR